jgi:hypothetical protein
VGQFLFREPSKLVINERQQLRGRLRLAALDRGKDLRDFAHCRASITGPKCHNKGIDSGHKDSPENPLPKRRMSASFVTAAS